MSWCPGSVGSKLRSGLYLMTSDLESKPFLQPVYFKQVLDCWGIPVRKLVPWAESHPFFNLKLSCWTWALFWALVSVSIIWKLWLISWFYIHWPWYIHLLMPNFDSILWDFLHTQSCCLQIMTVVFRLFQSLRLVFASLYCTSQTFSSILWW